MGTRPQCGAWHLRQVGSEWCLAATTAHCVCGAARPRMGSPGGVPSQQWLAATNAPSSALTGPALVPLPQVGHRAPALNVLIQFLWTAAQLMFLGLTVAAPLCLHSCLSSCAGSLGWEMRPHSLSSEQWTQQCDFGGLIRLAGPEMPEAFENWRMEFFPDILLIMSLQQHWVRQK